MAGYRDVRDVYGVPCNVNSESLCQVPTPTQPRSLEVDRRASGVILKSSRSHPSDSPPSPSPHPSSTVHHQCIHIHNLSCTRVAGPVLVRLSAISKRCSSHRTGLDRAAQRRRCRPPEESSVGRKAVAAGKRGYPRPSQPPSVPCEPSPAATVTAVHWDGPPSGCCEPSAAPGFPPI